MASILRSPPRLRISRRACASAFGLSRPFSASCTRRRHIVPTLAKGETWASDGIPGLYSKTGFEIAWTEKQEHLINQLNERTDGTAEEGASPKDLLINNARQPEKAALFNYASMAHNNNFFFSCLGSEEVSMPTDLREQLETDFSSLETLKMEFLATGNAMFGPGFVWLVKLAAGESTSFTPSFRIFATYNAGSPYPGAHYRRQPVDMNNHFEANSADILSQGLSPANFAGKVGPYSKYGQDLAQKPPGGAHLTPALCVNVWEHAWLPDYGVAGKAEFLEAWWRRIDWAKVQEYADV